jgi:hypothetical protein
MRVGLLPPGAVWATPPLAAWICLWTSACAEDVYPDAWGRECGEHADSGDVGCPEPFDCVLRDDLWNQDGELYYQCSVPCTSDADCSPSHGGDRAPVCMRSGYCANIDNRL